MKTLEKEKFLTSKNNTQQYDHTKTQETCDNYTDGVFATLALVNEVRWDSQTKTLSPTVKFEVGRRLTTSDKNKISPSTDVTPDCTIQCNSSQGIVAEAKLGLPRNLEHWEDDFEQLLKYDDELAGWWNSGGAIDRHDIVALVPIERAVPFTDNLQTFLQSNGHELERKTSVVGFFKKSGVKDFIGLKKNGDRFRIPNSTANYEKQNLSPLIKYS